MRLASANEQQFELSFADLPLEELNGFLQDLGNHLLIAAYEGRRPLLGPLLASRRQLLAALERPQLWAPPTYRAVVRNAIRSERALLMWQTQTISQFQQELGLNAGYQLPEALWEPVGERAWNDPDFLQRTHAFLENSLRRRTLFVKDSLEKSHFPFFRLSPRTFWLLIGMAVQSERTWAARSAGVPRLARLLRRLRRPVAALLARVQRGQLPFFERVSLRVWVRIGRFLQWIVHAIDRLSRPRRAFPTPIPTRAWKVMRKLEEVGKRLALVPGWAGVWDQWLLLEASRAWSLTGQGALGQAVRQLPLEQMYAVHTSSTMEEQESHEEKETPILLEKPGWSDTMPAWFGAWLESERARQAQ